MDAALLSFRTAVEAAERAKKLDDAVAAADEWSNLLTALERPDQAVRGVEEALRRMPTRASHG